MSAHSELLHVARQRLEATTSGKTRIVVQVGHCSQAVEAKEVADALRDALSARSDAYLVIAGCDGTCFAAPQVIINGPTGATQRYMRVASGDVPGLLQIPPNPPLQRGEWKHFPI